MVGIERLIFGYREIFIDVQHLSDAIKLLLRLNITSDISNEGKLVLGIGDAKRFIKTAEAAWIQGISEIYGLPGFFVKNKNRFGCFLGVVLSLFLYFLLSGVVWDVRVSGNIDIPDSYVVDRLAEVGFSVGKRFSDLDKGAVETEFLSRNSEISWISINRRGVVAYVEVIESKSDESVPTPPADVYFADIVAERDGVIEEISVKRGTARVRVGDTVRAGDVLISGMVELDGRVEFVCAEGSVRASSSEVVTVTVPRVETVRVASAPEYLDTGVKIFGFPINIFKNYRNLNNGCDIIEDETVLVLFEKYRLPISTVRYYGTESIQERIEYTDTQMVEQAGVRMRRILVGLLGDSDLSKLRTSGNFDGDGYSMTTTLVFSSEIGVMRENVVNEKGDIQ